MLYLTYEELKRSIIIEKFSHIRPFVVPYLWGIETINMAARISVNSCMLYLTYEELKHPMSHKWTILSSMLYLTYEELKLVFANNLDIVVLSLYLTYEELKLIGSFENWHSIFLVVPYLWGIETIKIHTYSVTWCTSLYLTYEELKLILYPRLISDKQLYLTYEELKLLVRFNKLEHNFRARCTLPMRNWNAFCAGFEVRLFGHRLYLTYEELKR